MYVLENFDALCMLWRILTPYVALEKQLQKLI